MPRRQIHYGKKHGRFIDNETHPLDWAACGTRKNYRAHIRRGQKPCRACVQAENMDRSMRKQKQNGR